jgi:hypothetical protein
MTSQPIAESNSGSGTSTSGMDDGMDVVANEEGGGIPTVSALLCAIVQQYHDLSWLNISPRFPERHSALPIHMALVSRMLVLRKLMTTTTTTTTTTSSSSSSYQE